MVDNKFKLTVVSSFGGTHGQTIADPGRSVEHPTDLSGLMGIGSGTKWWNLWKPTIDALDPLPGNDPTGRDWHPLDGGSPS